MAAGVLGSALLAALYVRGGAAWPLGFVVLLPWLLAMDHELARGRGMRSGLLVTLLGAVAMAMAFAVAGLGWFAAAIARFAQIDDGAAWLLWLLAAPLVQPQFIAFALVRHLARRSARQPDGALGGAPVATLCGTLAGIAAWLVAESFLPRLLGDTLGHGLYPSVWLRQGADLGGAIGLTAVLLLVHEALAAAWARRGLGAHAVAAPLAVALALPVALAAYGAGRLDALHDAAKEPAPTLRVGLVQSAIVDYERLRRERGAGAVVREVLDLHYAMTYDAVERQKAQAVLWSETVYPTTFGRPKSEAGAELDREIQSIVDAAGVPFVFGTYERDEAGEYNAAAFVEPGRGLLGFYRKTRLFPLTEHVPPWLDGASLRRWLPWTGTWQPGSGARVFPLRLRDGREVPVLPMICRDTVDASLAREGARLGAQALISMSNDSWFTAAPLGAELHLAVAAFRSIETRLPQFRVTSNGLSAVIDATGAVRAGTRMGERTLVVGELPVGEPPRTLAVAGGDWVARLAAAGLVLWTLVAGWATLARRTAARGAVGREGARSGDEPGAPPSCEAASQASTAPPLPARVIVLPPAARAGIAALQVVGGGSLFVIALLALVDGGVLQMNPLAQLRGFAALVVAPLLGAWLLQRAYTAELSIVGDRLVLARGPQQRLELPLRDIVAVEGWRAPLPAPGAWLCLAGGSRWPMGLAGLPAADLVCVLSGAGTAARAAVPLRQSPMATRYDAGRAAAGRSVWQRPVLKFGLLPLVLALPAYRLHQHIAFGSSFGEWLTYGALAWLQGLALWWAAWAMGVALCAAVLRAAVEGLTLAALASRPARAASVRRGLERAALLLLYLGLPAWLAWRALAG